jgi:hypothetical protein
MEENKESKESKKPLCKFYLKDGKCRNGESCRFQHVNNENVDNDVDKENKDNQRKVRDRRDRRDKRDGRDRKKKNTESFIPSFESSDMTVKFANYNNYNMKEDSYPHVYEQRDVVFVSNLFEDMENVYEKLIEEIKQTGKEEKIWKLWHGDTHYIADDKMNYKEKCPTFMKVIDRLTSYFRIDPKATRLNWFSDKNEWKPYHFDAAAVDKEKAKVQNFTVGVSFGDTREVSFQHANTRTTVNIPLLDGSVYCFGSQVNMEWRHGIPPITEDKYNKGRISVIIWGWVDMK